MNTSSAENNDSSIENHDLILSLENISRKIIHTPIPIVLESVESFTNSSENRESTASLVNLTEQINSFIPIILSATDELEETVNHIDCYPSSAGEACLVSICPQTNIDNECISIAPGQGKQRKSILNDRYCEEVSFPHPFPRGKSGYPVPRDTP